MNRPENLDLDTVDLEVIEREAEALADASEKILGFGTLPEASKIMVLRDLVGQGKTPTHPPDFIIYLTLGLLQMQLPAAADEDDMVEAEVAAVLAGTIWENRVAEPAL